MTRTSFIRTSPLLAGGAAAAWLTGTAAASADRAARVARRGCTAISRTRLNSRRQSTRSRGRGGVAPVNAQPPSYSRVGEVDDAAEDPVDGDGDEELRVGLLGQPPNVGQRLVVVGCSCGSGTPPGSSGRTSSGAQASRAPPLINRHVTARLHSRIADRDKAGRPRASHRAPRPRTRAPEPTPVFTNDNISRLTRDPDTDSAQRCCSHVVPGINPRRADARPGRAGSVRDAVAPTLAPFGRCGSGQPASRGARSSCRAAVRSRVGCGRHHAVWTCGRRSSSPREPRG
jgi:hypothetical protein